MATKDETLELLTSLEKDSYRELIDIATENYVSKQIQFDIVSNFIQGRINRLSAINSLIDTKRESDNLSGNYVTFREFNQRIRGKSDELDRWNGILGQTVYGDVRDYRLRKREIIELTKRNSTIISEILNRYDEFNEEMEDIYNRIT